MRALKTRGTLAAGILVAASLVATTTPAAAAETCQLGAPEVLPSRLAVIGTSGVIDRTLRVKATNCSEDDAWNTDWYWVPQAGDGDIGEYGYPALIPVETSGTTTTFEASLYVAFANLFAGDIPTDIYDGDYNTVKHAPTLQLRRATRVTTNASPEPIRKGHRLTVKGKVTRANWDTGRYTPYAHHQVDLQFSPVPHGDYVKVKTVTSSASGSLKTTIKATKDGCYRYYSKQTSTSGAKASVGDCVDVR
jgi:hypothetical protein